MRPSTRTGLLLALLTSLAVLPTAAVGALPTRASAPAAPEAVAANSQTYEDSTGEDPAAPDINTIVVSNTDAGIVTFRVNVPNRPTFMRDILVWVFVDTDNNQGTGDPDSLGSDYLIELFNGEAALFRWDGEDFTRRPGAPAATSLVFSYRAGVTIRINATELGNTKRFRFGVTFLSGATFDELTGEPDFTNALADLAPAAGAGLYPYQVKITPPTLVVKRVATTPTRPAAGTPFTMRVTVARSDTGALLRNGRVRCVGRVGTAPLRPQVARVLRGAVTCTWLIPAKAKGKTFRGSASVVFEGLKASRNIVQRIG